MVNLSINGRKLEKDDNILFGEFLNALNRELAARAQVISVLKIDGQTIDEAHEPAFSMRNLSQVGKIEITTVDQLELAFEARGGHGGHDKQPAAAPLTLRVPSADAPRGGGRRRAAPLRGLLV
jgi:hypothetical protein